MKIISGILIALGTFLLFPTTTEAQDPSKIKKVECQIEGVCNMCKTRIEQAALIKGVKMAEWSKESQSLWVIYNPQKVELNQVLKAIADAGHDSREFKASEEAYAKLPNCCRYRNGEVEVH